jgi:hypothetical protein
VWAGGLTLKPLPSLFASPCCGAFDGDAAVAGFWGALGGGIAGLHEVWARRLRAIESQAQGFPYRCLSIAGRGHLGCSRRSGGWGSALCDLAAALGKKIL